MNATAKALEVAATPITIEEDVALCVVRGVLETTLDAAINRLGRIQDAERALEAEKKALREGVEEALRREGLKTYKTDDGRSATVYETTRITPDWDFIATILTPEQLATAKKLTISGSIRIR